jgi:hypothetical protein
MSKSELNLQVAPLKWSCEASRNNFGKLNWVDSTIYEHHASFRMSKKQNQYVYRHRPYGAYLPDSMSKSAIVAQQNGEPTVLEGLLLLFARMEWLTRSRRYYWTPMSPVPQLLAVLVEALGVGNEIHRDDHEVLSRLTARLPTWLPSRGTAKSARNLLIETVGESITIETSQLDKDGNTPIRPDIVGEVFSCQSVDWWKRRIPDAKNEEQSMNLRLDSGFLSFQNKDHPIPLHREDILVGWKVSEKFPTNLLRLLPAWICLRIVVLKEDK